MPLAWNKACSLLKITSGHQHLRNAVFNWPASLPQFSSTAFKMNILNTEPVTAPQQNGVTEVSSPSLTAAILRYQPNGERFQFSFIFKGKKFNFDRAATEMTSSFLERIRGNLLKHIKASNGIQVKIISAAHEHSPSAEEDKFPLKQILDVSLTSTDNEVLQLEVDSERIPVRVNPPEVVKIKFLRQAFVGFPILPLKLEGSSNFNPKGSKYIWEFRREDPKSKQTAAKKNPNKRRKSISNENWSPCGNNTEKMCFIPDESLKDAILRLTIVPLSTDGQEFGLPYSEEGPKVTEPPVTNHLFRERLSRMDPKSDDPNVFRVVSYNVLADLACTPEWFCTSPKDCLTLDYRLPLLNAELSAYQGDLLCLQEVDQKLFEANYEQVFEELHGYKGIFSCKVGDSREGLATFFNPSKFELLETTKTIVNDHMLTLPFFQTFSHLSSIVERISERNTVLQVSVFQYVNRPDSIFIVANTHLYFKPDADHIRTIQTITCISYITAKLEEYKLKYPAAKVSVIFCGDFNCCPPYGSYRLLTGGKIDENDEDWTQHETEKLIPGPSYEHTLNLVSSHPNQELTSIVTKFDGCIDYIFYQPNSLQLLKSYPPLSKSQLADLFGVPEVEVTLPNFQAASDHLPLISDFQIPV